MTNKFNTHEHDYSGEYFKTRSYQAFGCSIRPLKTKYKRMKFIPVLLLSFLVSCSGSAQKKKVYDENADIKADIEKAVALAKKENKHVMLQIGANWCPWCLELDRFCDSVPEIKTALGENFIVQKVNYDRKKANAEHLEVYKRLGYPQRFGFPVIVILDADGKYLHTQNSAYLEEAKSYNAKEIMKFIKHWKPGIHKEENYKKK